MTQRRNPWLRCFYGPRLRKKPYSAIILGLLAIVGVWLATALVTLMVSARAPVDAILVLGGSIRREIHVAALAKQFPKIPILISSGSADPCIRLIFERESAPIDRVWLEKCARSTFGNFMFSAPLLQQWNIQKVQLVTSPTHLPRSHWLAKILLGSKGIWVKLDVVKEKGVPGNRESWFKTALDVTRSLGWAVISQVYSPTCREITPLAHVDVDAWRAKGFACEHQGNVQ